MYQKSNYFEETEKKHDPMDRLIEFLCKHDDWLITFGVVGSIMGLFQIVCLLGIL